MTWITAKSMHSRLADFREEKEDILREAAAPQILAVFKCSQGTIRPGDEELCLFLRRLRKGKNTPDGDS